MSECYGVTGEPAGGRCLGFAWHEQMEGGLGVAMSSKVWRVMGGEAVRDGTKLYLIYVMTTKRG